MMPSVVIRQKVQAGGPSEVATDDQIVARVRAGDTALFEVIMRRYNQRLFRAARAILRDGAEAEDVVQEAYVNAYAHLDGFAGRAAFSTWLTKIVVHEAFARRRRRQRFEPMDPQDSLDALPPDPDGANPARTAASRELAGIVEAAIDTLPDDFRIVFMLRVVEEMSVNETATCLEIPEDTVKSRLFRARALVQERLSAQTEVALRDVHAFLGARCDGMVARVLSRIAKRADHKPA